MGKIGYPLEQETLRGVYRRRSFRIQIGFDSERLDSLCKVSFSTVVDHVDVQPNLGRRYDPWVSVSLGMVSYGNGVREGGSTHSLSPSQSRL